MIKTFNMVPSIYYKKSRDFQLLLRLIDVVMNDVKTNSDLINSGVEEVDTKLVELAVMGLGFIPNKEYSSIYLNYLYKLFHHMLRNKGTKKAIEILVNAFYKINGYSDSINIEVDKENWVINIYTQAKVEEINTPFLENVLDYILPVGFDYKILGSYIPATQLVSNMELSDINTQTTPTDIALGSASSQTKETETNITVVVGVE